MSKVVLISGATAGIGEAAATIFSLNKYRVIICGRRKDRLEALAKKLEQAHGEKVYTLSFDIRKVDEVKSAIDSLPQDWKNIDILLNNAGLAAGLSSIDEGSINDWEQMIDTNVKGILYMTRFIAPLMSERNGGHIINIGSIAGKEVYANGNVYCATKHAVDALTKGMRIDLLPKNIKVTGINPGMVETEFSIVRFKGDKEKASKVYNGMKPLTAEDIAETIFWCATRPAHVNINDLTIMPTVQANATTTIRNT